MDNNPLTDQKKWRNAVVQDLQTLLRRIRALELQFGLMIFLWSLTAGLAAWALVRR